MARSTGARSVSAVADGAIKAGRTYYHGFTYRETAGTTATIAIYDNASAASGTLLDSVQLAANESAREYYAEGILAVNGIYVDVTGTVVGSIRAGS